MLLFLFISIPIPTKNLQFCIRPIPPKSQSRWYLERTHAKRALSRANDINVKTLKTCPIFVRPAAIVSIHLMELDKL